VSAQVVAAAQRAAQAGGQFGQQPVAGRVAEAVVDRLEAVQVQVAHDQQAAVAVGRAHGVVEQQRQPGAVGQSRQFVEVSLTFELFALLLLLVMSEITSTW
jgi:hypothetical protein